MILGILKFVFVCVEVVLLFNLLIIVHELGHFLAARWRGLVVEKFAIWFGKPIWSKTINGVEYRLGSIPAGGFVAIPQLAPMETLEGQTDHDRKELPPVKPLDKIIVALAGPVFSFGLALVMATIVWGVGTPDSESDVPVIGMVVPGGPAEVSGLKVGDKILKVDGQPVTRFLSGTDSVKWRIVRSEGETIPFLVQRGDQTLTIPCTWTKPETSNWRRPALREIQVAPRIIPGIGAVLPDSVADKAGLKADDLIKTANGKPIFSLEEIVPIFESSSGKTVELTVTRGGQTLPINLPIPKDQNGSATAPFDLGIEWGRITFSHPNPFAQVRDAATTIFRMIDALLSPKSDVKASHFSGPVGIMHLYYRVFENNYGWQLALSLSVLINVNLGMLNLLPLPVLDGGHILLAILEAIRRKPINARILEAVQTGFAILLIGFMLYVTFFDVGDFIPKKPRQESPQSQPAK